MLPGMNILAFPGLPPAEIYYLGTFDSNLNLGTYTFNNIPTFKEGPTRQFLYFPVYNVNNASVITGSTVEGVAATEKEFTKAFSNVHGLGCYLSEIVATGTEIDISFSTTTACNSGGVMVFEVHNLQDTTPLEVFADNSGTEPDFDVPLPSGAIAAFAAYNQNAGAYTWTNATDQGQEQLGDVLSNISSAIVDSEGLVNADVPTPSQMMIVGAAFR